MTTEISSREFAESPPEEYRARFDPSQIAAHAHAAVGRQRGKVAMRRFPWRFSSAQSPHVTGLCVVADDRPGLLSLISSAFTELGFNVEAAEAYTRNTDPPEAVDVFWVRAPHDALGEEQIQALTELIEEILAGRPASTERQLPEKGAPEGTTVRFIEDLRGNLSVLEIETDDRSGLLWSMTRALFDLSVQIVSSSVRTENDRVHDRFHIVELDGSSIGPERRLAIQVALLTAIQPPVADEPLQQPEPSVQAGLPDAPKRSR